MSSSYTDKLFAVCTQVNGDWRVTHLKLQKSQKGDITHQHIACPCAKFCCSRLMGFDSVRGQSSRSPIDLAGRP